MKKYIYTLVIIFIFVFTPKVFAFTLEDGKELEYGNQTYAYNWASSSSWTSLGLHRSGANPFYTDYVTTGTNGISFGQFYNGLILANHYYRLTWVASSGGGANCGSPASWDRQLRFGTGMGNDSLVTRSYTRLIGIQNDALVYIDDSSLPGNDICTYTVVFALNNNATFFNVPVNSTVTLNNEWFYYGFYLEDIGSTDTVSNSDLQTAITNMQNSINNNSNTNTQNIINNQNQNQAQNHQDSLNTQNKIDDLNDSVTDDTVNSNTGKSFFDNFSDNTHGLSGIITAPLNIIRQLINVNPTSCSALSTTYHNKTISMPCGAIFWGHTGFSQFNTFYNMVVGGAFCYLIIKDLFLTIEKLKDPDNDKVEVMDL